MPSFKKYWYLYILTGAIIYLWIYKPEKDDFDPLFTWQEIFAGYKKEGG